MGASHDPAFIVLVLIKGMRKGGESKIFFCCLRDLRAFPQVYREPLGQAIILLVKWVGGNWGQGACSNFEYKTGRSLGKNNFLWTFFFFLHLPLRRSFHGENGTLLHIQLLAVHSLIEC